MNKGKKKLSILLLILLLLGLMTAAVLASRLGNLNKKKDDGTVSIPIGDDAQRVSSDDGEEESTQTKKTVPPKGELVIEKAANIFCTYYEDGHMTVKSGDGQKVIAPGTKWNTHFSLLNTFQVSLDYEVHISVEVEGLEEIGELPLQARLRNAEKWLIGGSDEYVPFFGMQEVVDAGVLASGHTKKYTFGWQWPFEGDDEFDTMFGNMSAEEPIKLTVHIWIYAWSDEDPDRPGGDPPSPPTGDDFNIGLWMSMMIISLFVFVAVLANDRRQRSAVQESLARGVGGDEDRRK